MQNFWAGFEKRSAEIEKTAFWGDVASGIGTAAISHAIPNILQLKALKNKGFAERLGKHFSAGLWNTPESRSKAFLSGLSAAVMPEAPMLAHHAREQGNKLREFLVDKGIDITTGPQAVEALTHAVRGDIGKAKMIDPRVADAVLEFGKQNKVNPFMLGLDLKNMVQSKDHPLISNILPNLVQMPKRVRGSGGKAVAAPVIKPEELDMAHFKKNVTNKAPSAKYLAEEEAGVQGLLKQKPGVEDAITPVGPRMTGHPGADDKILEEMAKRHTTPRIKQMFKGKEKDMESYVPSLSEWAGPQAPNRRGFRTMGALAGTVPVAAAGAPITGMLNMGKYMYFTHPGVRNRARGMFRGLVGKGEDMATTRQLEKSFERGMVHGKPLNPITNAFHRYMVSGIQGEAARTANTLGRIGARAVPPEHRKNVYENVIGALHGVPGALQAEAPARPIAQSLKPMALPAAATAVAGGAAYAAGRQHKKNKEMQQRPQISSGGNVVPFVSAPTNPTYDPPQNMHQLQYGGM